MQLLHFKGSYSAQLCPALLCLLLYAKLYPLIVASCYGDTSLLNVGLIGTNETIKVKEKAEVSIKATH